MNDSLDPRIDRMMAALYGELSESEERAFQRVLEQDPALRAEWEELQKSRSVLSAWKVEESVPSFVMLEEPARRTTDARPAAATAPGWWERVRESLGGFGFSPAWGLATAAVAVVAFLVADSRVNSKVDEQIAARLAELQIEDRTTDRTTDGALPGVPIESLGRPGTDEGSPLVQVSGDYLTRAEYESGNDQVMQTLVTFLNEYDEREDREKMDLLQAMYERVNQQQLYDYRQLSGKLDDLGHELLLSRSLAEQKIDKLLGPAAPRELTKDPAPTSDEED